jgi:hypothetical protein
LLYLLLLPTAKSQVFSNFQIAVYWSFTVCVEMSIGQISLMKSYRRRASHKRLSKSDRKDLVAKRLENKMIAKYEIKMAELNRNAVNKFTDFINQESDMIQNDPRGVVNWGFCVEKYFVNEDNVRDSKGRLICRFYKGLVSKIIGDKYQVVVSLALTTLHLS